MSAKTETRAATGLFDQAVQAFEDTLKAGVRIQEEMTRWWTDAMDIQAIQESQKRSRAMMNEVIPAAQKSAEQWLKLMEQNYRRSVDLLQKAFATDASRSPADVQARTQEMWQAALEAVRESAQSVSKTNMDMMEAWSALLSRNLNGRAAPKAAAK